RTPGFGPGGLRSVAITSGGRAYLRSLGHRTLLCSMTDVPARRGNRRSPSGIGRVEVARDQRPGGPNQGKPRARTASAGQGRTGCVITHTARRAATVAARVRGTNRRLSQQPLRLRACDLPSLPVRLLAPTEGEETPHERRDRGRRAECANDRTSDPDGAANG